jgi:hypothetical protein
MWSDRIDRLARIAASRPAGPKLQGTTGEPTFSRGVAVRAAAFAGLAIAVPGLQPEVALAGDACSAKCDARLGDNARKAFDACVAGIEVGLVVPPLIGITIAKGIGCPVVLGTFAMYATQLCGSDVVTRDGGGHCKYDDPRTRSPRAPQSYPPKQLETATWKDLTDRKRKSPPKKKPPTKRRRQPPPGPGKPPAGACAPNVVHCCPSSTGWTPCGIGCAKGGGCCTGLPCP